MEGDLEATGGGFLSAERPTMVDALRGVHGRIRMDVGDRILGVLEVEDGNVLLLPGARDADAIAVLADPADFKALVNGQLNPVVAALQGKIDVEGDVALAIRVILGLQRGPAPLPHGAAEAEREG